ncbi:MAG TPA: LamG-like jellyroll fold domain-containing protein [Pyrinomonadaceae bacterium]|nr:LamG-like jellyroll fold domain-containing protein [Pyrinomonadaceae bacterium]
MGLAALVLILTGILVSGVRVGLNAAAQSTGGAQTDAQRGSRGASVRPKRPSQTASQPAGTAPAKSAAKAAGVSLKGSEPSLPSASLETLSPVLAATDFNLIGLAVTADPASQSVPKNTPTRILTSVQVPDAADVTAIIAGLNPNYRVRGELVGPSFGSPQPVEAAIGQPISIPPLSQTGEHVVQNLRVVDIGQPGEPVVAPVTPDACGIVVFDRLLVSEVHVNELTYDQIVQAGINISDDSYRAFNFTLGIGTTSDAQTITIPVAFPQVGVTDPRPIVGTPSISAPGVDVPTVVPVMLTAEPEDEEEGGGQQPPMLGDEPVRIPGVIVFPGRVGFLHQFFEAIVIVSNGAPNGTPLVIKNLRAKAKLPDAGTPADASDDPLRIAETQAGGRVSELDLHGLGPDGKYGTGDDTTTFSPGQAGQATFLLEGLKEGLHTVNFGLDAELEGLPGGAVHVSGEVPGAVLVRDASFAVTFTHPSVVRAGQEYDLAMTVYNSGSTDIQGAFARLTPDSISGAELLNGDTGARQFATTIKRKDSATVKWRLRSHTTGAVTASYVKVGDDVSAGLQLVTGVGDRNVALSPDSLILPDPVKNLPPGVVEAARAVLGQAWGVANAPAGSLPEGVTPIKKQAVIDRAVELGIAGIRVDFGEPASVSLDTLVRDWLGELKADDGFADALRGTPAGNTFYDAVGAEVGKRLASAAQASTPADIQKEFADAESPRSPFISALMTQAAGQPVAGARLVNSGGKRVGFGASEADARAVDLQSGAALALLNSDAAAAGQWALVSNPASENWTLEIDGWRNGAVDLTLVYPGAGRTYRQVVWGGVAVAEGGKYRVVFRPTNGTATPTLEAFADGAWQALAQGAATNIGQPAPRLVGAIQVTPEVIPGGDKYGRLVGLLFSKPMQKEPAETIAKYTVGGGELKKNPSETVGGPVKVKGARLDYGDRFVFLALDSTIGPYVRRDITVASLTDTQSMALTPAPSTRDIEPRVSPQGHPPGAYLTGRVLNADGNAVPNAPVVYWTQECPNPALLVLPPPPTPIAVRYTDAQGRYEFDYVRDGDCAPLSVTVNNPQTHAEKRLTSPVAYDGQHMVFDMVFLARGNVRGTVTSGGRPVARAFVQVVPQLDVVAAKVAQTDDSGNYSVTDIPVGNVSVSAVGTGDLRTASGLAAGTIPGPNQTATINVALQNVSGVVRGRVLNPDNTPQVGALVVAYARIAGFPSQRADGATAVGYAYADRDGAFTIKNLPVTDISLELTDYVTGLFISQRVQLTEAAPEVSGLLLRLPGTGTVTGRVMDETGRAVVGANVRAAGGAVNTDGEGYYTLQGLRAGTLDIMATDPVTKMSGGTTATVRLGAITSGANITILRPAFVEGHVYTVEPGTTTAKALAGAKVTADGVNIIETDSQGAYRLENVMTGAPVLLRFVDEKKALAVNMSVILSPGETLTRDATLRTGTIRGRVTQPDGVTGVIADVALFTPKPSLFPGGGYGILGTEMPVMTRSAADGTYSVEGLNPGTFRATTSNVFFPTPVSAGGVLAPGGTAVCDLSLVSTLAGKIQGRVFQPDGATPAPAGTRVTLSGGSLADATVRTDASGHYEFAEVFSAGGYALTATDPTTGNTNRIYVSVEKNKDAVFDLRLLGTGSLKVKVVDGAGQPVSGGTVTLDGSQYPNQHRFAELTADAAGVVEFSNLPEGPYAVAASNQGLGGRAAVNVPLGSSVETTIQLLASGTVEGRVLMPGGSTPVGLADVQLTAGGRVIGFSVTSDAEADAGHFQFLNVPAGDFTLDVFDNRTGRVGRSFGRITTQGETATVNVELLVVGTVTGRVTANGQPVDHALVEIYSDGSGLRSTSLKATTDPDGRYRFTGIPAGRFTVSVKDAPGGQTGSATGVVSGTTEPLPDTVADIALEPSQTVTGTVYKLGGTEVVPGAQITIFAGGRQFRAATNETGVYRLSFVPLGEVRVRAEAPAGNDRGESAPVTGTQAGGTVNADVTFAGTGDVSGAALDSNGSPLTLGEVVFTNSAWGAPVRLTTPVRSDGRYEFKGVPAGAFTLKLSVAGRVGVGTGGATALAGQNVDVPLRLEDAGKVTGRVVSEASGAPVAGVDVTLTLWRTCCGGIVFYTHSDSQGVWALDNLPLGAVTISISDPATGGIAQASNLSLTTNGQVLDVGEMRLDATPIRVVSVSPADGAADVSPTSAAVTVNFSEPALGATVNTGTVRLLQGASQVPATLSLSDDKRTATLTPTGRLADTTGYTVSVAASVADLNGLALGTEFRSTFTTADATGPIVTGFSPANNATRVALSTDVVVTFNERLDPAQDFSQVVAVTADGAPPAAVPGTLALSADGLSVTFHPTNFLGEGSRHTVTVQGQRDVRGNATAAASSAVFTTIDLMPPVIEPLPIDGKTVRTFRPQITAAYADNASGVNLSSVVLTLDGANVTPQATLTGTGLSYTPASPLARGPHTVTLNLSDNQGNAARPASATFSIDDAGPAISSFQIAGLPAANEMYVTSTLQPSFVVNYTDDTGVSASATKLYFGPYGSTLQPVAATVTQTSLGYTPAAPLAEGRYSVEAVIVNNLGTSSTTGRIDFTLDMDAPEILSSAPASGSQHGGTTVTITGNRLLNTTGTPPAVTVGGNAAQVASAVAGSPDQVVFVTPAGAPGPADIRVSTNRGDFARPGAFTYEADPRTPFVTEPDTVLLWHMDEIANGAVRVEDSGPTHYLVGTASGASLAQPGRFGGGRASASVQSASGVSELYLPSSLTLEGWFKTAPVGRTYTIFGKEDMYGYYYGPPEYAIRLAPNGSLRALAYDGGSRQWFTDMPASTVRVDDDQWHYVALVLDRAGTRLSLYVDGVERAASTTPPANFGALYNSGQPFRAGKWAYYEAQTTGGPEPFPGTVDEVRLSSTAHSASTIQKTYLGTEGALGVTINNSGPVNIAVGTGTEIQLVGYNLAGATPSVTGPAGAQLSARVLASSATQARVLVTAPAGAPLGDAQLVMSSAQGSATLALRVIDLSHIAPDVESDTRLLWHMDETANGAVTVVDSGRLNINGTASGGSLAQPGRFNGGRASASVQSASSVADLYFGTSSFTVEGWVKTGPVGRTYTLFGKEDMYGYYYGPPEYAVRLAPSGSLRALVYDGGSRQWFTDMPASVYGIDDNVWHYVVMVVDRANTRLSLYVDGVERSASTTPPSGFGALYNSGQPFRAGKWAYYEAQTTGGGEQFPGVLDEIRVSSTAHTAERILNDLTGNSPMRVTSFTPKEIFRDKEGLPSYTNQLTVNGYNLDGATARLRVGGQDVDAVVNVVSGSFRQAVLTVNAGPSVPLGVGQIVFSKPGQADASFDVRVAEQAQATALGDTVLLWNLNETGNGAVRVFDSGALGIGGTAGPQSLAQAGHFGGGRSKPVIIADGDNGALSFGASSFTAECWVKTNPVGRTYTLVGKEDMYGNYYGPPEFAVKLLPGGGLRAIAYDAGFRQWRVETAPFDNEVDDNLWHHVAMVVDRANGKMSLFLDGVERASSAPPSGFSAIWNSGQPLRVGKWSYYDEQSFGGNEEFPGTIDDVRISSTAHTAQQIVAGMNGVSGVRVNSYNPQEAPRNRTTGETYSTVITLSGFGLDGVTAALTRNGQPLDSTATVESSTFNQAQVRLSIASGVAAGKAQLVLSKPGASTSVDVRVTDQSELATDTDTRLLWHMNETGNGAVRIADGGPLGIGGTAGGNSQAQPGHFGGGRSKPVVVADGDYGALYMGSNSFTAECWFKTNPVGRTYTLVGKEDMYGNYYGPPEFAIRLLPSGGLRAQAWDAGFRQWKAEVAGRVYDATTGRWQMIADDNQWHHAAMVVDRANAKMTLYVDGVERASSAAPSGFGALWNSGQPLRVGKWSYYDEQTPSGGNEEFPGTLDEVRISSSAHAADKVLADTLGTDTARVSLTQPAIVQRGTASVAVTFTGYGLTNATVTTDQPLATVAVVSSSSTQLNCLLNVPSGVPVGALHFAVTDTAGHVFSPSLTVVDQQAFTNDAGGSETPVLWHLDETGNGAVRINGSGDSVPNVVGGTASGNSQAQPGGRFGGGRAKANVIADTSAALNMGSNSFTVECWVKTAAVGRTYTLVGKEDMYGNYYGPPEFAIRLLPSGGLRAQAWDTGFRQWVAEMPGRLYDATTGTWQVTVNDGQWHFLSMAVDRANSRMTLYVDGVERASAAMPANFGALWNSGQPLRVGKWSYYDEQTPSGGNEEFPGTLDEVRVLNYARSAAQVKDTWLGTNTAGSGSGSNTMSLAGVKASALTAESQTAAESQTTAESQPIAGSQPTTESQPEIRVDSVTPGAVVRDKESKEARATAVSLKGANLGGVTARVMREGQPLKSVVASVQAGSDAEAAVSLAVSPQTPLGPARLVLSKPGFKDAEVEIRVVEPGEFAYEADTVGLWHMDERDEGASRLLDAGERGLNLNASAASRAAAGRFGGGRTLVRAASEPNAAALAFGTNGFTVEGWVKSGALARDYVLFGKESDNGQNTEYTLKLTASGALRAEVYDLSGAVWQAETAADAPKLTDDEWHSVALVVDRAANLMLLYVDGRGRAVASAPPDFAAVRNLGQPLVFGCYDADGPADGGPQEFPGVLDEVRVSSTPHRAEKIAADFFGHDAPEVTLVRAAAQQQPGTVVVTLHGYGLGGVTVAAAPPEVKVSVRSLSRTRAELLLTLPDPRAAYGPVRLTLTDALGQTAGADVDLAQLARAWSKATAATPSAVSARPPEQSPPPRPPAGAYPASEGARSRAGARSSGGLLR